MTSIPTSPHPTSLSIINLITTPPLFSLAWFLICSSLWHQMSQLAKDESRQDTSSSGLQGDGNSVSIKCVASLITIGAFTCQNLSGKCQRNGALRLRRRISWRSGMRRVGASSRWSNSQYFIQIWWRMHTPTKWIDFRDLHQQKLSFPPYTSWDMGGIGGQNMKLRLMYGVAIIQETRYLPVRVDKLRRAKIQG